MITIVQWGSKRSLCKVYNKDTQGNYESVTLMLVDNDYLLNIEPYVHMFNYKLIK